MMLAAILLLGAQTLTFPVALQRALPDPPNYNAMIDALPARTLPIVRAETAYSSAENLNLLSESIGRTDAFTAIVSVDYPLLDAGINRRRRDALRADAQVLSRRALDEADATFEQTLEAFAQLYLTEERIRAMRDGAMRATALRQRARTLRDAGEISNVTAARWLDQSLATESALVDLELQRLDAETRLKQLIGDTSDETLHASIAFDDAAIPQPNADDDAQVARATIALQEATASRRPQLMLSAFGGIASVPNTRTSDDGSFGIYGIRLSMTFPMFDAATARRYAEARMQLEEATRARDAENEAERNRIAILRVALAGADKRLALMNESVAIAKEREASMTRLVRSGARTEADLFDVANDIARRESELLAVRVERWKIEQRVRWMSP